MLLILILNSIVLAGPVLLEVGPVLLSANITYIDFEFASQQAPPPSQQAHPSLTKSKSIINSLVVKPHFFSTNTAVTTMVQTT
jgi:hypothetical protein